MCGSALRHQQIAHGPAIVRNIENSTRDGGQHAHVRYRTGTSRRWLAHPISVPKLEQISIDNICKGYGGAVIDLPTMKVAIIAGLSATLQSMSVLGVEAGTATPFHSSAEPQMSISSYVERVAKYFRCSYECFVMGLIYVDRLIKAHPYITVNKLSIHRLVLVSMTMAAKFHEDTFYSNEYYATAGGVTLQELNALEARFLKLLGWRLNILPDEYNTYQALLVKVGSAVRA